MKHLILCFLYSTFCIALWTSCQSNSSKTKVKDEHEILNEDSLALATSYLFQNEINSSVTPDVETEPIKANTIDDAADDPAIWLNKNEPSKSIVFGSNKKGGISATNLAGKEIAYYETGNINNIDIHYNFPIQDTMVTLLGSSNRSSQSIDLFVITTSGELNSITHPSFSIDTTKIDDIYGFCFGYDKNTNRHYIFINGKNGLMQQFELITKSDEITLDLVREIQFDSQTEGMVTHQKMGTVYIGEEAKGIWMIDIDPNIPSKLFVAGSDISNPNIKYDIEGLTIFSTEDSDYLLASSQGNFSYAVFDISSSNKYLGSFKILGTSSIDGVEETDGIDILTDSLNTSFPNGILVVQDGFNYTKDSLSSQNFKYIDCRKIKKTILNF